MNEQQYEKYLNIETAGYQQGYPKKLEYHRYEPTPYAALDELFTHYELPPNSVVVDVGCGKGRVPFYIHEKFHVKVKGIEMDPKFFAAAEYNKSSYQEKHSFIREDIHFYQVLAEEYEVQAEDNVFFFFNPFSVHIFRVMLNKILESKEREKREVHLIFYYASPEYRELLMNHDAVQYVADISVSYSRNERFLIYRIK